MRNLTYTPDVPYPQRQLFLCVDALGRLCAASTLYLAPGETESSGVVFDWLTTADGGHTFQATPVHNLRPTRTRLLNLLNGKVCFASVSPQTNLPCVFSTLGSRVSPTGSGEDDASWQRPSAVDTGFGEIPSRRRSATKSSLLIPPIAGPGGYAASFLMAAPVSDLNKYTLVGEVTQFSAEGTSYAGQSTPYTGLYVHHSYDGGRSTVQSALLPLTVTERTYRYSLSNAYYPFVQYPHTVPYMVPAKEGEPGSGLGLMPRCRISTQGQANAGASTYQQAWGLFAACCGDSADTLYAVGAYTLTHPDTGNDFLGYYLIKSLDCGLSWASFDPAAPLLVAETTYVGPHDPRNYGYDIQPDGTYRLHAYPPIVFPVCGANGLPPTLPWRPTDPNIGIGFSVETRVPQMIFAHGTLYLALPSSQLSQPRNPDNTRQSIHGYRLLADGTPQVIDYQPAGQAAISPEAYGWVFVRSADLDRTWEALTSPPPMQYGTLAASQNGHRLHWGLHSISDDGGHTWKPS